MQLIIVVIFTFLGAGIFRLVTFEKQNSQYMPNKDRQNIIERTINSYHHLTITVSETIHNFNGRNIDASINNIFLFYIFVLFFIFSFGLPVATVYEIFGNQSSLQSLISLIATIFMLLMFCCGFAILAFFDKLMLRKINEHHTIKFWVICGSLISLALLPYLGATSEANFKSSNDLISNKLEEKFNTITLTANSATPIGLGWEKTDNNLYQTTNTLYEIYASDDTLYIKVASNLQETISIPKTSLVKYQIHSRFNVPPLITTTPSNTN